MNKNDYNNCYIKFIKELLKIKDKNSNNDFFIAQTAQKYNIDYNTILTLNTKYNICYYNPIYTIRDYLIKNSKGEYLININKLV